MTKGTALLDMMNVVEVETVNTEATVTGVEETGTGVEVG